MANLFVRVALAVLLTTGATMTATAASIVTDSFTASDGTVQLFVFVSGEVLQSDSIEFERAVRSSPQATVVFNSPGGDLETGIAIGRIILRQRLATAVVDTCASACALAWLAGAQRYASRDARIGFHVAYVGRELMQESGLGNALVGLYLGELGLGENVVRYVSSAAPDEMQWLTPHDANLLGIKVTLFDAPVRTTAATALRPDLTKPVPGFDPNNVARAVKNGLARYKDAGMFGLQESSATCWQVALNGRTLDKVQYCRALDLVGATMNAVGNLTFGTSGSAHFETGARASALNEGLLAVGIDDAEIANRIGALWKQQFDQEIVKATR